MKILFFSLLDCIDNGYFSGGQFLQVGKYKSSLICLKYMFLNRLIFFFCLYFWDSLGEYILLIQLQVFRKNYFADTVMWHSICTFIR